MGRQMNCLDNCKDHVQYVQYLKLSAQMEIAIDDYDCDCY